MIRSLSRRIRPAAGPAANISSLSHGGEAINHGPTFPGDPRIPHAQIIFAGLIFRLRTLIFRPANAGLSTRPGPKSNADVPVYKRNSL